MDLFVWFDEFGAIRHFQLSYDKLRGEKVLEWREHRGYLHARVDDDRGGTLHPGSPLMKGAGPFARKRVAAEFGALAAEIEPYVARFVHTKLRQYLDPVRVRRGLRSLACIGALLGALAVTWKLLR